jgi:FkbH-like protein
MSMQTILEHARQVDPLTLSSADVRRVSRAVRRAAGAADARVAFAGNIVFEPLTEFLEAHLACEGITGASYIAPFGQGLHELLNACSALHQFDPNFLLLHFELHALLPELLLRGTDTSRELQAAVQAVQNAIEPVVHTALKTTSAVILLTNFSGPDCYERGLADSRSEFSEQDFFAQINSSLAKAFRLESRVQIVDLCRLTALHGRDRARDRRLYYLAKMPWHESFLPVLADELVRHIGAALGRIRKCLAVDLDNTLWAGVLGEDGPHGIGVGVDDAVSEAYYDLQRRILALKKRGIVLAVCSKNNPAEVDEVFRVRSDMPLRRDDFACLEVGWDRKDEGLRRIARRLNIGTDSLVFLDDNPAEIELIRQLMPEVECVLLPADPASRPTCLDRIHSLDRVVITTEDIAKTAQYHQNAERDAARAGFADLQEYLHGLKTRLTIQAAGQGMLARAHQLFMKTNQFNLTARRLTIGELEGVIADSTCRLLMIHAEDRFGSLGWIGAVLLRGLNEPQVSIDSFLLSCRAMGRGIESAALNCVKKLCFERKGCESLLAEYRPTAKNAPVREFFEAHGFSIVSVSEGGDKSYRQERHCSVLTPCDWIAVDHK